MWLRVVRDVQDEVLIAGFGRRGHAVGDIPGVRFKVGCPPMVGCPPIASSASGEGGEGGVPVWIWCTTLGLEDQRKHERWRQ